MEFDTTDNGNPAKKLQWMQRLMFTEKASFYSGNSQVLNKLSVTALTDILSCKLSCYLKFLMYSEQTSKENDLTLPLWQIIAAFKVALTA